jgi:excinuclease ABC subunit A
MSIDKIVVHGAKENNLKNIDIDIPKNALVLFTGLSGSGKSTLAFDTIYAEGQRRYVESLSSYARMFLGNFQKPDVESIEGLSPAISIDQKSVSHNPRSTVGTVTEIYDYLRLLFSRVGIPYCPHHHIPIVAFSTQKIVDLIMDNPVGTRVQILAPIVRNEKGTHKDTLDKIKANGFTRVRIDGNIVLLDEIGPLEKNTKNNIDIVIDRIVVKEDSRSRIFEAVELASEWANGYVLVIADDKEKLYSEHNACPICGFTVPKLEPRLFSFNNPLGCCPSCNGLGFKQEVDIDLLVPDKTLSIDDGAILYYKNTVNTSNLDRQNFKVLLDHYHVRCDVPFFKLSKKDIEVILNGSDEPLSYTIVSASGNIMRKRGYVEGLKGKIERLYQSTESEFNREYYAKFLKDKECQTCHGARLNEAVLSVLIDRKNIYDLCKMPLSEFYDFISSLNDKLTPYQLSVVSQVINEIKNRVKFLLDVGLNYLTLARLSMTLSGGESQRIRLATQIGSKLSGILYVLDEPSIGLHQRDSEKLIKTLKEMRDLGNTVIVVEHDEDMIRNADYIVDIGPGAGVHGGEVVAKGSLKDIEAEPRSVTGQYLSGKKYISVPLTRRKGNGEFLEIDGCTLNNLKSVDCKIPLGSFVCVTGVSGSGKSSLINETLYKAIYKKLNKVEIDCGPYSKLSGLQYVDKVINISQEPIGQTPRSNPATYVKAFDDIRDIFANTIEARARGYTKSRFSFNVPGGRCEHCYGAGVTKIPMNFLPDVYVKCDECDGKRYNEETLLCTYKGKNIYDVLEMTIEDAYEFFKNNIGLARKLKTLVDVGLGYMKVGQPATTLSGGEAQRVKLAYYLEKRPTGKTVYILDEPTTGLHTDDIARLLKVLEMIVDNGDTVVVIEHNMEVIKMADYIIDLGPEGGDKGGEIIATGTPEEIVKNERSYTGQYLKKVLEEDRIRKEKIK